MELRLTHATSMFSHQIYMLSQTSQSHANAPPTNQFMFNFIPNIVKSQSHLISYNMHGIILNAYKVNHSIM